MTAVGLLYAGALVFVNAVMLPGKAEPRRVGVFTPLSAPCGPQYPST